MPTPSPHAPQAPSAARPLWMLLAIALPLGVLLNRATSDWSNLADALLLLMDWQHEPTGLQRHAVRVVAHVVAPALLVFGLLKATRLGAWLVPNRLALGCLLVTDAILVAVAVRGLVLAAMDEPPFMRGMLSEVSAAVAIGCMSVGLASLVAATAWYRVVGDKRAALERCKHLLRQV